LVLTFNIPKDLLGLAEASHREGNQGIPHHAMFLVFLAFFGFVVVLFLGDYACAF
jgi:hypothetical protein